MCTEEGCWTAQYKGRQEPCIILILQAPSTEKPPLVFIHGAGHGAWCWQVMFCKQQCMPLKYQQATDDEL